MKIEQYHHDEVDTRTYDLLRAFTGAEGPIDDRLVAIYLTYKATRDVWNRNDQVSDLEWRFICYEMGLYAQPLRLPDDLEKYFATVTRHEELPEELRESMIREALLFAATKRADSPMIRVLEYKTAILGLFPMPEHIINILAERFERWNDLQESKKRREAALKPSKDAVIENARSAPQSNGRILANEIPDGRMNTPVSIVHYGHKRGVLKERLPRDRILFVEDDTGKKYRLASVKFAE